MSEISRPDEADQLYRTLALAVYNQMLLSSRFPLLLYKKLLGKTVTIDDVCEVDAELVEGLSQILAMAAQGEDVLDLGMSFAAEVQIDGTIRAVELRPNDGLSNVTNENYQEYVEWYTSHGPSGHS
jgi:hypothetical protein